jgi:hypothetical protein
VLFALAGQSLLQALDQPPGVGRDPEQVGSLLQRLVVRTGQQNSITLTRGDLDRSAVVIDFLDERKRFLRASLAVITMSGLLAHVHVGAWPASY